MAEPNTNPAPQEPTPGTGGELTFTQAELDALIGKEKARAVAKATKGMPNEEELSAFRAWQENQKTEQQKLDDLVRERDENKTALATARAELEQMKREQYVMSKGFTGDEADFIVFKAGKAVDDKTSFESAVDSIVAERGKKPAFDWQAPVGGGNHKGMSLNERINNQLRGL